MEDKYLNLLKNLYAIQSYSGNEEPMRRFIRNFLNKREINYIEYNGNILGLNDISKPLLSSHMDMVNTANRYFNKNEPYTLEGITFETNEKNEIRMFAGNPAVQMSLGADDKNGIFIILVLLDKGYHFNFVFSHGEEIGMQGISQVVDHEEFRDFIRQVPYALVLDRRNSKDIIGYDNKYCMALDDRLEHFSTMNGYNFRCASGLVSDADRIAKNVECVNLSVGYYEAHSKTEYTNLNELENSMNFVQDVLSNFVYFSVSTKRIHEFKGIKEVKKVEEDIKEKKYQTKKDKKKNKKYRTQDGGKKAGTQDTTDYADPYDILFNSPDPNEIRICPECMGTDIVAVEEGPGSYFFKCDDCDIYLTADQVDRFLQDEAEMNEYNVSYGVEPRGNDKLPVNWYY